MKKNNRGRLLQVAQLGNPVLRKKAPSVKNIKEESVRCLIDDLTSTVMDVDGVGIAASQVYQPLRLFIVASHPSPRYPNAPKMKPTAIINPKIILASQDQIKDWEGCLSVPGIRGLIPRSRSIFVEYTTREGERKKRKFKDFVARIFQHEYDHLEGLVFLDRLKNTRDIISEKEFQKMVARQKEKEARKNKKKPIKK